jgi:hypothetical protein
MSAVLVQNDVIDWKQKEVARNARGSCGVAAIAHLLHPNALNDDPNTGHAA